MERIKHLTKRSLTALIVLCMVLSTTIAAQAKSIGGSATVSINKINYTITINYIDDEGNAMPSPASTQATLTGAGQTYTALVPSIEKYTYAGYYVEGNGSLADLSKGDPKVTSRSDGTDSSSGKGSYTLNIVYSADENENEIPDKNEHYVITEKFEDTNGQTLMNDKTVSVNGDVKYYGTVPTIRGYKYVGYYYNATHMTHTGGSAGDLLTGTPYILMLSPNGLGTYVNHMVFEYDTDQWATITYDKNSNEATGTMDSQTALKGDQVTLNANQFTRSGYAFKGWSTSANATVAEYGNQAKITLNQDITLYAVWEYDDGQWATITYNKNAIDATGTMDSQTVLKGSSVNLTANKFLRDEYVFLGWSESPNGTVQYADQATITTTKNMTLYAVWGTPDLYYSFNPDRSTAEVGDTIGYVLTLGNADTINSTPWYNAVATITFNDYVGYVDGSIVVKLNGNTLQTASYDAQNKKLMINLGTMNPGDEYVITFNGTALVTAEGDDASLDFDADGDLVITKLFRSGTSSNSKAGISGSSGAVSIVPAE